MTIYMTREGTKLTADIPTELIEKLYQAEPNCFKMFNNDDKVIENESLSSLLKFTKLDSANFIAELIQNDYLSVIDPIDG